MSKKKRFQKEKKILLGIFKEASSTSLSIEEPVTFDDNTTGPYLKDEFKQDWDVSMPSSQEENYRILEDAEHGKVLNLTYQAGEVGGNSGMAFTAPLHGQYEHLFFEYDVYFPQDFDWVKGGKLPGLTSFSDHPTGCIDNSAFDGFSARYMWREEGAFYLYIYNPEKELECGDYYPPVGTSTFMLKKGQWLHLKQEIFLGEANQRDGYIKAWVDDVLVYQINNIMLRDISSIFIDGAKMDSFFGGSDDSWAPATSQNAYFDNFRITLPSTKA
jgi:hypothetical protein